MAPILNVRAVVFDAYGTLFDVSSAAERLRKALGEKWRVVAETWRAKQLQYTWLRSLMGRHADFWRVTTDALDFALQSHAIADGELHGQLLEAYERLDAYPDARPSLEQLRAAGLKTAILSNGAPRMLTGAARAAHLEPLLDLVLSVEDVHVYKPHPSVYGLAVSRLGVRAEDIAFVSANGWDACGAKSAGLRVAWCNRTRQPPERIPDPPDVEIRSLAELPTIVRPAESP